MRYPSYVGGRRHPRAGRPHPFLYAGARNRRTFAHKYFGTQPTGYGLRGGDPRTSGVSGAAGRVYRHMLGGAMRPQRGTGYRTSHQLGHYRGGLSKAGKDAYASFMRGRTRHDFGSAKEFRAARSQARRERSQARRGYARDYKNPYTGTGHRRFTKVSHRDPGTGIRRNYFGGFTGNLSQGSRNLIDRRHKQLQGVSQRKFKKVDWGRAMQRDDARRKRLNKQKGWNMPLRTYGHGGDTSFRENPKWTVLKKDGVWHRRKPSGEYTPLRPKNARQRKAIQDAQQLKANQAQWRNQISGLSAPRRTTYTFTPDDPRWRRVPINKSGNYGGEPSRYQYQDSVWQYGKRHPLKSLARRRQSTSYGYDSHGGYLYSASAPDWVPAEERKRKEGSWHWRRPEGKIRTKAQSLNPAFVSSKPFGSL